MKDRDGNEFKSVPADGHWDMTQAALALLKSKNCWDLTVGDLAAAISNAIAAAPQFVAGEVTEEMCQRVAASFYGADTFANGVEMHEALQLWRKELGPALGLVTREEMARSITIRDTEIARLETDLELARRGFETIARFIDEDGVGAAESCGSIARSAMSNIKELADAATTNAMRWVYARDNMFQSHSTNKDGTSRWHGSAISTPRARSLEEAIDAARAGNGGEG